jgi:hypothetical protein
MPESERPPSTDEIAAEAMSSAAGKLRLQTTHSQLWEMFERQQFNTDRAVDAFSAAIHWAVWESVRRRSDGRKLYGDFKRSHAAPRMAQMFAEQFKRDTGAYDQRQPRRWLRFLLGP